jgi:signal transduction histidine kinase
MTVQIDAAPGLAALLTRQRDAIAATFVGRAGQLSGSRYGELPEEELRTSAERLVDAAAAALAAGSAEPLEEPLARLSRRRLRQGFDVGEVIEGLLIWREAALLAAWNSFPTSAPEAAAATSPIKACARIMIARLGQLFARVMQQDLERQQRRTSLVLHAVRMASGSLELEEVLERVAEEMVSAVGGRYCGIYLLDQERGALVPRATGGEMARSRLRLLRKRPLDLATDALVRDLVVSQAPVICADATADPRIDGETAAAFGVKSILVVPITAGGRVLGAAMLSAFEDGDSFTPEDVALASGIADAVALAIENARLYDETRRRLAESQGLQRVTAALLQRLSLGEVLEIVCREARQLTGALGSTVFLLEGGEWLRVAFTAGEPSTTFDVIPIAGSLTGQAVQTGKPVLANDPAAEEQGYAGGATITALLAVPLRARGVVVGALDVVSKPTGFNVDDVLLMSLFADQAAIAIENARLHQQVEQLAVIEERQRLARELHDSVTQSLYSVTLYGEAAARLLSAGNYPLAAEHLRELRDTAQEALREMRLLIFELRPPVLEKEGLAAALQTRLEAVEGRAGLQSELQVEGEGVIPIPIEEELYRVAQEALNNVLKHAKAQRVKVRLRLDGTSVALEVRDDGVGFNPALVREKGGLGLRGMAERARRIGSALDVQSAPGRGTTVKVVAQTRGLLGFPAADAPSREAGPRP